MKAMIVIITIICFVPPIIAVFDIIRKLKEQKYKDDAQDLFYKEIVKSIDEQKKKNSENTEAQVQDNKKEINEDISEVDKAEDKEVIQEETQLVENPEKEDIKNEEKESESGIAKEAALEIVMNMLKTNRDNKKETTSGELDSMISILNEAKKKK